MYKKNIFLGLVTSVAFVALLSCKPVLAETLQESVSKALAAHPSVEGALAGKDIAKENKKEARSNLFPTVSAGTSVGRIYADNSTSRGLTVTRGAAYSGLFEANATVTQPIFDGMETKSRIDAAQARMQSAEYNVLDVRENLALRATQSHIGVLQAQATLNRTKSYFEVIEDYLSRIELMVEGGVADEVEAAQARNISLMLKSTLTDYEGQLQTAIASYKEVIGQTPNSALTKPAFAKAIDFDMSSAIAHAKSNHPLLKSKKKEIEAIEHEIKAEKGVLYPDLDAELSGIKRDQKEEIGGELEDARALLRVSWEFETGGASQARTRKLRAQYLEIVAENKERFQTIEADIQRAYAELNTATQQLDLVKKREVVTSDLFEAYKNQFEGARVRLLQLMQAENQLFASQLESIAADYRYLMAYYTVLASIGELQNSVLAGGQGGFSVPVRKSEEYSESAQKITKPILPLVTEKVQVEEIKIESVEEMDVFPNEELVKSKVEVKEASMVRSSGLSGSLPSRAGVSERVYISTE